jgi:hypothetical protein
MDRSKEACGDNTKRKREKINALGEKLHSIDVDFSIGEVHGHQNLLELARLIHTQIRTSSMTLINASLVLYFYIHEYHS